MCTLEVIPFKTNVATIRALNYIFICELQYLYDPAVCCIMTGNSMISSKVAIKLHETTSLECLYKLFTVNATKNYFNTKSA